ncbi:MAG: TolC family protein [Rhizobiaceae bacterium]
MVNFLSSSRTSAILAALFYASSSLSSHALSLKEAVSVTLDSNPDIEQAIQNREAIEFELRQAKGLALPSVDLEAFTGVRRLDSPSRRALGTDDNELYPSEVGVVATQTLFDGGRIRGEIDNQASRVDSASFRILERSETIGLNVVREYIEYLLQAEILQLAVQNLRTHEGISGNIRESIAKGTLTSADGQQGRERLLAAKARVQEAEENLSAAAIRFNRLVGVPLTNAQTPPSVSAKLPSSLDKALGVARKNNPLVKIALADIDAQDAAVSAAKADFAPEITLEGRARTGDDIDSVNGRTSDLQARVILRWNLYRGGIKKANEQEQIRRASEQRMILHQVHRRIEEAVRIAWDRRLRQSRIAATLAEQSQENAKLVNSYREQFAVGQRSLLDVLDAQNTRFNVDVLERTAGKSALLAQYTLLAATGQLLQTFGLESAPQTEAYARAEFDVPETLPAETYDRVPTRQVNDLPMDLLAPIRRKNQ